MRTIKIQERSVGAQWFHGIAHQTHTEEHQAQSHKHCPVLAHGVFAGDEEHGETDGDHQQSHLGHFEGDYLRCQGGTDIGSKYDSNRLGDRENASRNESDSQDRGDRGRLKNRGYYGTGDRPHEAVGSEAG